MIDRGLLPDATILARPRAAALALESPLDSPGFE